MISLLEPENKFEPELGDLLVDFKYLDSKTKPKSEKAIPLACIYANPFHALTMLDIDTAPFEKAIYECPYTKYKHYAVVPVALLLEDDESANRLMAVNHKYPSYRFNVDYVFDWEWHRHLWKDKVFKIHEISKIIMGSGYTHYFMINDGSPGIKYTNINLSNGDALWVAFYEWYNK